MKDPSESDDLELNHRDRLLLYIITVCYPKMKRRFQQPDLSAPYIHSLNSVNMAEIEFRESEPMLKLGDQKFFKQSLVTLSTSIEIPNICEQRCLYERQNWNPATVRFYTKDTYREFHVLLLDLLGTFDRSLKNLESSAGRTPPPSGTAPRPPNLEEFRKNLKIFALTGLALQNLANGAILETHLKTIESSLKEHRRVVTATESMPEVEPDQDDDLEAVQPLASIRTDTGDSQEMPLHMSYKEWLKLMLIYFDAINIINNFVDKPQFPFKTISIKVLVSPAVSKALLPWKELFTYSDIFSQTDVLNGQHLLSGNVILSYLQSVVDTRLDQSYQWIQQVQGACKSRKVWDLKNSLSKLKDSKLPGWEKWAQDILLDTRLAAPETGTDFAWVGERIELLLSSTNVKFLKYLRDADRHKFSGTMHCEAALTSLLRHSKNGTIDGAYEDIRAQLEVCFQLVSVTKYLLNLVTGFWTSYRSIKTLLPNVSTTTLPL